MSVTLSIVIFTRDDADHLRRCLASLAARPPSASFETIVVDNASTDDTADVVRAAPLDVLPLLLPEEDSFSNGNNAGLDRAEGTYVLFLNPDTLPTGDVIDRCLAVLAGDPSWSLVSPRLAWPDGSHQPTGWRLPEPGQLLREHLGGAAREVPLRDQGVTEVGWLMGCFLMGRTDTLRGMGGFDPAFWFHGTDLELCARAPGKVGRVESVTMVHVGHRGWDAGRRRRSHEALVQWLRRDHGPVSAGLTDAAARLVEALRS